MPLLPSSSPGDTPGSGQNARYGLWFFAVYCALYAGFMGLTAFSFKTLGEPIWGVNWAIIYGMGLIVGALVLAMLYMLLCNKAGDHPDQSDSTEEGK